MTTVICIFEKTGHSNTPDIGTEIEWAEELIRENLHSLPDTSEMFCYISTTSILAFMAIDIVCKEKGYKLVCRLSDNIFNNIEPKDIYKFYADQMIRLENRLNKVSHNSKWLSI